MGELKLWSGEPVTGGQERWDTEQGNQYDIGAFVYDSLPRDSQWGETKVGYQPVLSSVLLKGKLLVPPHTSRKAEEGMMQLAGEQRI